ncbi:hypothetical protein [Limnobaculum sp. M2-1]
MIGLLILSLTIWQIVT